MERRDERRAIKFQYRIISLYSFSTTGILMRFISRQIVAADAMHKESRLAFNSGVSSWFTALFL